MMLSEIRRILTPRRPTPPPRRPEKGFKRFRDRTSCRLYEPNDRCGGCDECLAMQSAFYKYDSASESKRDLEERLYSLGIEIDGAIYSVTKAEMVEAFRAAEAGIL